MKDKTPLQLVTSYMQEQNKCYDALLIKLEEQKKAIVHTNESRLTAIIEEKSELIAAAKNMEEKIEGVFMGLSKAERDRLIDKTVVLRGQIENSLKRLIAQEAACEDILNVEKIYTQDQIKELQQKKNMFKGYGNPGDKSGFSKKA